MIIYNQCMIVYIAYCNPKFEALPHPNAINGVVYVQIGYYLSINYENLINATHLVLIIPI